MNYYHVLIKHVPQLLTYRSKNEVAIGSLITTSLGKRTVNGLIIEAVTAPDYECLEIGKILQKEAVSPLQIELCRWMSQYYFASFQRCIQLFLPQIIWHQKIQPKKEVFFELSTPLEKAQEACKKSQKQLVLVQVFTEKAQQKESDLRKAHSASTITALLKKDVLKKTEGELLNPDLNHLSKPYHDQPLTSDQQKVLDIILNSGNQQQRNLRKNEAPFPRFLGSSFLLHGITGSGKTEIYLQLIKKNIQADLQTVLLVPEIALTTELIQYFSAHFPDQISIIHSRLSDRDRVQTWHRIHQGKTKLIIGSRSALFTPWKNLGAIIIDEEHEWTYKQEQSPRYHAKTVAEQIVSLYAGYDSVETIHELSLRPGPFLVLGSATPSLESYFQSQPQELQPTSYQLLSLPHRATAHPLPPVTIVDLRQEYQKKNFSMFSETLQEGIRDRLQKKEQVILFLNKRGSSSSITCRDCGYTPRCENCDIALTYHHKLRDFEQGGLLCHYCGSFEQNLSSCPQCRSKAIRYFGTGTQKAEEQLQQLFPEARILRADKDTTGGKHDFETITAQMRNGEADILLGTQIISKGLDLPNVTLTGIILADIGLHLPDFRASERVFQQITQVSGRSGRHKPGEVIIQTYQPEHPAIKAAKNHDYIGFYKEEISIREQLFYPPFSNVVKLIYAHEEAKKAEAEAKRFYSELSHVNGQLSHVGLSPNYIPKLHGKYLWNITIRSEKPHELLKKTNIPSGWKIDRDALS